MMKVLVKENSVEERDFDTNLLTTAVENNYRAIFRHNKTYECPEKTFRLKDLIALAAFYDVEFAIYETGGSLFVKKGEQIENDNGIAGHVRIPEGATMLVHTHPCYKSYRSHIENDLKKSNNKEVVVDFSLTIIVYKYDEVFNTKNESNEYISLPIDNDNWPEFLTRDISERVYVKL